MISLQDAIKFIDESNGRIFSIRFLTRGDEVVRQMRCRTGVKKKLANPDAPPVDWKSRNLIGVYDMDAVDRKGEKGAYRSIPIEGFLQLMVDSEWVDIKKEK